MAMFLKLHDYDTYHIHRINDVQSLRIDGYDDVSVAIYEQWRQRSGWSLNLQISKT